jgi:hypothetical protein
VRVVPTLEPFEHVHLGFGLSLESPPAQKLALERGEEALGHSVVIRVTDRAHRGHHAGVPYSRSCTMRIPGTRSRRPIGYVDT